MNCSKEENKITMIEVKTSDEIFSLRALNNYKLDTIVVSEVVHHHVPTSQFMRYLCFYVGKQHLCSLHMFRLCHCLIGRYLGRACFFEGEYCTSI